MCSRDLGQTPSVHACEQALLLIPVGRQGDEFIGPQDQPQRTAYSRLPKGYHHGERTAFLRILVSGSMPHHVTLEQQIVDICSSYAEWLPGQECDIIVSREPASGESVGRWFDVWAAGVDIFVKCVQNGRAGAYHGLGM